MKFHAQHESLFGWNCSLRVENRDCGNLKLHRFGRSGSIEIDGEQFTVDYQGLFSGCWQLRSRGAVLLAANKSALGSQFAIPRGGETFALARPSLLGRNYTLRRTAPAGQARQVGSFERAGWFSRSMDGELPDDWSLPEGAFLVWLVLQMWRRRARAASS